MITYFIYLLIYKFKFNFANLTYLSMNKFEFIAQQPRTKKLQRQWENQKENIKPVEENIKK